MLNEGSGGNNNEFELSKMKSAQNITSPISHFAGSICAVVKSVLALIRDIAKSIYVGIIQIITRFAYIEREFPSSISLWARLDVIPRARNHERHRLSIGRKTLIESLCAICT